MRVVYTPKGPAAEYAELAANPWGNWEGKWGGCSHACLYCYCGLLRGQKPEWYRQAPVPKPDFADRFRRDIVDLRLAYDDQRILLQFLGDPYCPAELEWLHTAEIIAIMSERSQPFATLTKGGIRACADFDRYGDLGWFGTSLVWDSEHFRQDWEPGTAPLADRCAAIAHAVALGIYTWASVEPVIVPGEALAAIQTLLALGVQDIRVGLIEHHPEWRAPEKDLFNFGKDLAAVMRDAPGVKWLAKKSLVPWMPREWREGNHG